MAEWNANESPKHIYTIEYLDFKAILPELQHSTVEIPADSEDEALDAFSEHIPANEIVSITHD